MKATCEGPDRLGASTRSPRPTLSHVTNVTNPFSLALPPLSQTFPWQNRGNLLAFQLSTHRVPDGSCLHQSVSCPLSRSVIGKAKEESVINFDKAPDTGHKSHCLILTAKLRPHSGLRAGLGLNTDHQHWSWSSHSARLSASHLVEDLIQLNTQNINEWLDERMNKRVLSRRTGYLTGLLGDKTFREWLFIASRTSPKVQPRRAI